MNINGTRKQYNRIFQITDPKITGRNNMYSPYHYYHFRNAIAENKSGLAVDKDSFYVITGPGYANRMNKALTKLGIEFKCIVNNLAKIVQTERMENLTLRKFKK